MTQTRSQQLADAYEAVAGVNNYMVGVVEAVTQDELDAAEQILISRQNAGPQEGPDYDRLELALDLIEDERRHRLATYTTDEKVPHASQAREVGRNMSKEQIVSLDTDALWAILRSTNPMTERFANELTWAKAELLRRGFAIS